jgi:heat-inducible transcriptional repressor
MQEVLGAVVERYLAGGVVAHAQSLASRIVEPVHRRAELAELERHGYLTHPHIGGRVPTDVGYRFYVEQLLARQDQLRNPHRMTSACRECAAKSGRHPRTTTTLSQITDLVAWSRLRPCTPPPSTGSRYSACSRVW